MHLIGDDVFIIAVKGAIDGLHRANAWITVDANKRTRERWMREPKAGVEYFAAVPEDFGSPAARLLCHRDPPEPGIFWLKRTEGYGLSEDRSTLHTGNSAYGALGLAYHMRPKKIAIFGVDATREQYGMGPGRPRGRLDHLPSLFSGSVSQLRSENIKVLLCSSRSRVLCFPRHRPERAIEWLNAPLQG